jgi:hypothetical protein
MAGRTMLRFVVVTNPGLEIGRVRIEGNRLVYSGSDTATVEGVVNQRAKRDNITPEKAFDLLLQEGWSNGYLMVVRSEGVFT